MSWNAFSSAHSDMFAPNVEVAILELYKYRLAQVGSIPIPHFKSRIVASIGSLVSGSKYIIFMCSYKFMASLGLLSDFSGSPQDRSRQVLAWEKHGHSKDIHCEWYRQG